MYRFTFTFFIAAAVTSAVWAVADDHGSHASNAHQDEMQAVMMAYATPGPEQQWLSHLAGDWITTTSFRNMPDDPWSTASGISTRSMELGGRYLTEQLLSNVDGMPFVGRGVVAWDNALQKFVMTWHDNMSTGITTGDGVWNAERTQVDWTMKSTDPVEKKTITIRSTWTFKPDMLQLDSYAPMPDGKEFHMMRVTYQRGEDAMMNKDHKSDHHQ